MGGEHVLTCNLFELALALHNDGRTAILEYLFYTDLPAGTRVILSCERSYTNLRGDKCVWVGHDEAALAKPSIRGDYNGAQGEIDVAASDRRALDRFRQIKNTFSSGITSPVSDTLTVTATVGARQPLKEFGKNNRYLSGRMVYDRGGVNVVEVCKSIVIPIQKESQPHEDLRSQREA
jgi:hypothetical protein